MSRNTFITCEMIVRVFSQASGTEPGRDMGFSA